MAHPLVLSNYFIHTGLLHPPAAHRVQGQQARIGGSKITHAVTLIYDV